jgi:asparagine synthase (glutamine-hydrolysing)
MGFGVPLDSWFRGELAPMVQETLGSERCRSRGWFEPEAVARMVEEHRRSVWDHSYRLWSLLMLELWARNYLDGTPPLRAPAGACGVTGAAGANSGG